MGAVAVLPDGRVVTGGYSAGRVLVWDPAEPGAAPVELGRHEGGVGAVAVLPDGRVVTGGYDDRVRLWNVRAVHPALCSHASRTRLLLPFPHLELASSSVTQRRNFMLGGTPGDRERDVSTDVSVPKVRVQWRADRRAAFSSR